MKKRVFAATLASALAAGGMMNAFAESQYGDSYPLEGAEGKSVTYWTNSNAVQSTYSDYTQSPFHTKLAENVGVDIQFEFPPEGSDGDTAYYLMLTEATLPDIILYQFPDAQQLLDEGTIIPLNDYIDEWAPNLKAYLDANPDIDKAIRTDDGIIYMFPWTRESTWLCTFRGIAVRQDWLDECGLDMPKTLDELDKVAHVFKEKYGAYFSTVVDWLYDGGISTAFNTWEEFYQDDDQKAYYGPANEGWREYMEFMNYWYDEGILDPDLFSQDATTLKTAALNDKVGIAYTSGGTINAWMNAVEAGDAATSTNSWVGVLNPVKNEGDITPLSQMDMPITGRGAAISSDCEDIELAMRVLDYAYSEEGYMYYNFGTEGETYTLDEEGKPVYTDLIMKDPDGINNALDKYIGTQWGTAGIQAVEMYKQKNAPIVSECVDTWTTNTTHEKHKFPNVSPTVSELNETASMEDALSTCMKEWRAAFITGEKDASDDVVWQEYLDELENCGLSRILEVKQAQLERYNAR